MQTILEEEASFMKSGGSWYLLLPQHMRDYLEIKIENNKATTDARIAMGLGKHGPFLYIYSPKQQRKWQKEKAKQQEEGE